MRGFVYVRIVLRFGNSLVKDLVWLGFGLVSWVRNLGCRERLGVSIVERFVLVIFVGIC